jgi:hypothetical protein
MIATYQEIQTVIQDLKTELKKAIEKQDHELSKTFKITIYKYFVDQIQYLKVQEIRDLAKILIK